MTLIEPIGPTKVETPYSIKNLPPLIIGGTVFNHNYNLDPENMPCEEILNTAFSNGLIAIDTSPYYGPSEEILGRALKNVDQTWPRESYYICTKVGRLGLNKFDYSRQHVRRSVQNSLKRIQTNYLDLVYMHDVEFVTEEETFEALKELALMKKEGFVRNIGVSAYPVDYLYKVCLKCHTEYSSEIGSLDAALSYANACIQNITLLRYREDFFNKCGIKKLMNGSILSLSLLRTAKTHDFHPASKALKQRVNEVAHHLKEKYGVELADLATRFAINNWLFQKDTEGEKNAYLKNYSDCSIVLGVSNVQELLGALSGYWMVKKNIDFINNKDRPLFNEVKELLGPEHYNETWESGIKH